MKKLKFILYIVVALVLIHGCIALDFSYKKYLQDPSCFMFHDTLWIYGGYHEKTTFMYISKDFRLMEDFLFRWVDFGHKRNLLKFNKKEIPNKHIYTTTDKELISGFFRNGEHYFNFDNYKVEKQKNKTIENDDICRQHQYYINFNDKIFIVAGKDFSRKKGETFGYGDVWVTSNGRDWKQLLEKGPWAKGGYRINHKMTASNNKIILIGGENGDGLKNDVWTSNDGIKWDFIGNIDETVKVYNICASKDRVYLLGLKRNSKERIFMSSDNLINWETHDYVLDGKLFEWNDNLMIVGNDGMWKFEKDCLTEQFNVSGFDENIFVINDTLCGTVDFGKYLIKSADGVNWYFDGKHKGVKLAPDKNFTEYYRRYYNTSKIIEFKDTLWLLDGAKGLTYCSVDGLNWMPAKKTMPENMFPPREKFSAAVFKDKLWIFGGVNSEIMDYPYPHPYPMHIHLKDSWYTTDGVNWTEVPNNLRHSNSGAVTVVNKDTLYMVGGRYPEIWATMDGFQWEHIMNFDSINVERKKRLVHVNALILDSKINIFETYLGDGYNTLEFDGKSKFTGFKENSGHHKRLGLENIVPFKDSFGNKLFVAKDAEDLLVSTDITKWNTVSYAIDSSFHEAYPYSTLVEFKGDLYFVKKNDTVVNSAKVELWEIPK